MMHIATLGKTVGLKGEMKFHIQSDFPEQFVKGASFYINKNETLTISTINLERGLVKIEGYDNPESAKKLTNTKLYTTLDKTRDAVRLGKDEYFWFDIIGCTLYENSKLLGKIVEVERIAITDYLVIETDVKLVNEGFVKSFLVPYHKNFIASVAIDTKVIEAIGAFDILEAS
ncbi:MAG: ribosome maturation factor RimM [Sulfurimonadaceae bacterium]|jgi:16S rRNA processing protein RimM|nr:ribosome maturation factor RimM [Sulfurimonadaceae bacterium]